MRQFVCFQFKKHKPLHLKIIKDQVYIEIGGICNDMLLPFYKCKTTSQFKNEFFKVINKSLL